MFTIETLSEQLSKIFGRPLAGEQPVLGDVYEALVQSTRENTHFRLDLSEEVFILLDDGHVGRQPRNLTFGDLAQKEIQLGKEVTNLDIPLLDTDNRKWTVHVSIWSGTWKFMITMVEMPGDTLDHIQQVMNGGDDWDCGEGEPEALFRFLSPCK